MAKLTFKEFLTKEVLTEGADCYCAHCGERLGKATELATEVPCGNCGRKTKNPDGDDSL